MLVHSSSMAVWSCWILAGTGTRCRICRIYIQSFPNMLNGWHVWWVCCPCKNWDVFSFQELCTDPCNMGPCNIMLQHEVMVGDEWHNNGPQDLIMVSLCIQNGINKMHLCSLSITYACPYHNPTATMGHSIHNVDISKSLTHTMPYTLSAICPVQWKLGFISPKCQTPSNGSICPLKLVTMTKCSQVETPDEDDEHADELPWDDFWPFVQKFFGYANRLLQQLSRRSWRWRCWMWRSWAGVVTRGLRLWVRLDVLLNSLKYLWRWLMVEKLTFNLRTTALVDIPAVSMPIASSLKTCVICGIVLCDKTPFRVAFYCGQPKAHLCNNHAV